MKKILKLENVVFILTLAMALLLGFGINSFMGININNEQIIMVLFSLIAVELFLHKHGILSDISNKIEIINKKISNDITADMFLIKRSDSERIDEFIKRANYEICINGITLEIINSIGTLLKDKMKEGCKVKLICINPNGSTLFASSKMSKIDKNTRKSKITNSLSFMYNFFKKDFDMSLLEIRLLDDIMPIGLNIIDRETQNGEIRAQHYLYNELSECSPVIKLRSNADEYWYNIYNEQWNKYWDNATIYNKDITIKE